MPKPAPTLYNLQKTTFWFACVSIALLGCVAWMVFADHHREWKDWQRKFIRLKTEKARAELRRAAGAIDPKQLADAEARIAAARKELAGKRADRERIADEIAAADLDLVKTRSRYQDMKQYLDSYRYFFEEKKLAGDKTGAEEVALKLRAAEPETAKAKNRFEQAELQKENKTAGLLGLEEALKDAERQLDALVLEKTRAERALEAVKPTVAKEILNAPMVDFIAPSLRIQQVVLDGLYDDYHFSKVQKVDRCTTCHLGIDQPGFEDAPQPFRTHTKLELFVGGASPHPLEKTGCTVCHGGNGHSVSFSDSAHMPQSDSQAAEWNKKYGWHALEKWNARMPPIPLVEGSCAKCHTQETRIRGADRWNRGLALAEKSGCFNCHLVKGFENHWKAGPDLRSVGSKVDREWMAKWIADPKAFRPSTNMPRIFHLSNTDSPEDRRRSGAAIAGITAYLARSSDAPSLTPPPVPGDPARGEALVKEVGCLGCHSGAGSSAADHGPELSGLGSKLKPDWLYTWLKNPRHLSPETRMPDMRLSDQEAADITGFLLTLKNAEFDAAPAPEPAPEAIDEMTLTYLERDLRKVEAVQAAAAMTRDEKLLFLGKKAIVHQGCFGCHAIKGFEQQKPIGAELSAEGAKDIHQFDFGHARLDHTREAWIRRKLKDPRHFDEGRLRDYLDKLRMPDFGFTDSDAEALTVFVLSRTDEFVPLEMQKQTGDAGRRIEIGRRIASKLNCNGCHSFDGRTGTLRESAEDKGNAPPPLEGEGAKVRGEWLHAFLKHPTTIRPWLKVRMPTFGFRDEEAEALVHYFAALDGTESYRPEAAPAASPGKTAAGGLLFERFQCVKCHQSGAAGSVLGASFLAPDLELTKSRLRPGWVVEWLKDPQALQEGTMMPGFFPDGQTPAPDVLGGDHIEQIEAIRDYLYRYEIELR